MTKKPTPESDEAFVARDRAAMASVDGLMGYPTAETFARYARVAKAREDEAAAAGGVKKGAATEKALPRKVESKA